MSKEERWEKCCERKKRHEKEQKHRIRQNESAVSQAICKHRERLFNCVGPAGENCLFDWVAKDVAEGRFTSFRRLSRGVPCTGQTLRKLRQNWTTLIIIMETKNICILWSTYDNMVCDYLWLFAVVSHDVLSMSLNLAVLSFRLALRRCIEIQILSCQWNFVSIAKFGDWTWLE